MDNKTLDLYEELSRLLRYSGKEVQGVSLTADGAFATVSMNGEKFNLFVTKQSPIQKPWAPMSNAEFEQY